MLPQTVASQSLLKAKEDGAEVKQQLNIPEVLRSIIASIKAQREG